MYHEALTHLPLLTYHTPRNVLIIDDKEDGILREVSRYKMIKYITMLELKEYIARLCQKITASYHWYLWIF
ncbi:hypothetical protein [Candidatus Erwinia haradaeae]|uniref:spermine/spermidine synthase domain-containing protein n=1 Tax=Candidatus Erwinia haradaeae TaxID=1922217 RepID=UPI00130073B0